MRARISSAHRSTRYTVLCYLLAGLAWIFFSDLALAWLLAQDWGFSGWQMAKGSLFVVGTAALLYALLRHRDGIIDANLAQIQFARQSYQSLFDHNPDAVFSLDLDGHYTAVNPATCEIFLGEPEDFIGEHFSRFIDPDDLAGVQGAFERLSSGDSVRLEMVARRMDGTPLNCLVAAMPIVVDGEVVGFHGVSKDISARIRAEQALAEREEHYRSLFDNNLYGVALALPTGDIFEVNPAACRILGYSAEQLVRGGWDMIRDRADPEWERMLEQRRRTGSYQGEVGIVRKDGSGALVQVASNAFRDRQGRENVCIVFRDITDERARESEYRLLAQALENAAEGMMILDREWSVTYANDAVERIAGFPQSELVGHRPLAALEKRDPELVGEVKQALVDSGYWHGELVFRRRSGELFPGLYSISGVTNEKGEITHYVAAFSDLTDYRRYQERVDFLTYHDSLTGLANVAFLTQRGDRVIRQAGQGGRAMAVLLLDLDRFKPINESLGYSVGDALLVAVAERLRECLDTTITVARRGGDEFVVLLETLSAAGQAAPTASRILSQFQAPFTIQGHTLHVSASIGIACYPKDGRDVDTLLRNADSAMYRAKELGRNAWQFYSADLNVRAQRALRLQNDLYQALESGQFLLQYQPIVTLERGDVVGAEALVRWRHPELGLIPPMEFIPVAEDSGLIDRVGEWVLDTACVFARRLHDRGHDTFRMSVNLSPMQFRRAGLPERVAQSLARAGIRTASLLQLEITENAAMDRTVDGIRILQALRRNGVVLALDDFGTGYSSLAYLKHLELDYLKIDKTFTDGILEDGDDVTICRAILSMAEQLGMRVIAEGIETERQWHILRKWGCDEGQGYFFSRPLDGDDFERLMETSKSLTRNS